MTFFANLLFVLAIICSTFGLPITEEVGSTDNKTATNSDVKSPQETNIESTPTISDEEKSSNIPKEDVKVSTNSNLDDSGRYMDFPDLPEIDETVVIVPDFNNSIQQEVQDMLASSFNFIDILQDYFSDRSSGNSKNLSSESSESFSLLSSSSEESIESSSAGEDNLSDFPIEEIIERLTYGSYYSLN